MKIFTEILAHNINNSLLFKRVKSTKVTSQRKQSGFFSQIYPYLAVKSLLIYFYNNFKTCK